MERIRRMPRTEQDQLLERDVRILMGNILRMERLNTEPARINMVAYLLRIRVALAEYLRTADSPGLSARLRADIRDRHAYYMLQLPRFDTMTQNEWGPQGGPGVRQIVPARTPSSAGTTPSTPEGATGLMPPMRF